MNILSKIFGDANEREMAKLRPIVEKINALELAFQSLSDAELRAKTEEFRQRLAKGETLDDLLPEAFAAVREAARRTIGLRHFDVQLMGGIVLHQGKIAEMKTGEGKTLVATLPLYLNALEGKGVHLVTVNDYLSRRDGGWMGPIYHALGLSVGVIAHEFSGIYDPAYVTTSGSLEDDRLVHWRPCSRQEAYAADITYGTNNEFGFDYLRDNMVLDLSEKVQRGLHYAIVDEVDNILIDEARTPLIISGRPQTPSSRYYEFANIVRRLRLEVDVIIHPKERVVTLTDEGVERLRRLGVNLPDFAHPEEENPEQAEVMHHLEQALKAQFIFQRDKDYVVKDGQVIIVDEFTGRLMYGRRWSDGLHEAIEAKEGVKIAERTQTLATITFQNYFRMYKKLAGMTGTAMTEAEEFYKIYKLEVVAIPTHKPMIRIDHPDLVYKNEAAKFRAIVNEIKEQYAIGRPVLVGTVSIERNEQLSRLLQREGIPHQVLNAKNHEKEALVIAQAGRSGMVTIATNMAGRGVDILLGGNPEGLAAKLLEARFYQEAKKFVQLVLAGDLARAQALIPQTPGLSSASLDLALRLKAAYDEYHRAVQEGVLARFYAERLVEIGFLPRELHRPTAELAEAIIKGDWFRARTIAHETPGLSDRAIDAIQSLRAFYEVKGGQEEFITIGLFQHYYQAMMRLIRYVLGGKMEEARRLVAETPELSPALIDQIQQIHADCEADRQRVISLGGLMVIGTERHEARRIDNQLRGRAGRQGDPGASRFYVALDDDLMKRFGGPGIASMMERLGLEDDVPIEHNLISKSIEQAQIKVEGYNFDIRKHLVEYDDVMNKQREVVYGERNKILAATDLSENILRMVKDELSRVVNTYAISNYSEEWDVDGMLRAIATILPVNLSRQEVLARSKTELVDYLADQAAAVYAGMKERYNSLPIADGELFVLTYGKNPLVATTKRPGELMTQVERLLLLSVIDRLWAEHLTILDDLREGISLRAYGQRDPKVEYQNEAYRLFQELTANIQRNVARLVFHVGIGRVMPAATAPSRPPLPTGRESRLPQPTAIPMVVAPLAASKLPKKALCWCGSGKRYEDCHGRRPQAGKEEVSEQRAAVSTHQAAGHKKFKEKRKKKK